MNWTETVNRYLREGRTVSGGKGDHSEAEQRAADQQRAMENNLMQQQLNMQMGQLNSVNKSLDPMIANGGMSPQQQAAMTSLVMNQLPQTFHQLQGGINSQLVARGITGGSMAGGGQIASQFGQLGALEGQMQQQGLSQIQMQKQQQLMQALGLKMGVGGMFGNNIGTFNQGSIGSLNAGVTAANNADQAQSSWMGPVFGALGSVGGAWAGGGFKH